MRGKKFIVYGDFVKIKAFLRKNEPLSKPCLNNTLLFDKKAYILTNQKACGEWVSISLKEIHDLNLRLL